MVLGGEGGGSREGIGKGGMWRERDGYGGVGMGWGGGGMELRREPSDRQAARRLSRFIY